MKTTIRQRMKQLHIHGGKNRWAFCNPKGEVYLFEKVADSSGDHIKTIAFLGYTGQITHRGNKVSYDITVINK
jgi:cobyrinic acid a,c-diamide synthase